jgi:hypothetical protein
MIHPVEFLFVVVVCMFIFHPPSYTDIEVLEEQGGGGIGGDLGRLLAHMIQNKHKIL